MNVWVAALIVTAVYGALAAGLALIGKNRVAEATPPVPAQAVETHRRKCEGGRAMGQDPDAIKEQIEQTRDRMGDTVDALGYKADVPARTKDSISGRVDTIKSKITGASSGLSDAAPNADDVKQAGRQAVGVAQENPLGLAIGAAAVGFLAGMLIPSTKIEDERIGPVADQVKEQAKQTGQEEIEHGKQIAQDTVQTATHKAQEVATEVNDQAQETAQQHAEELKSSAQSSVEEVKQTVQEEEGRT